MTDDTGNKGTDPGKAAPGRRPGPTIDLQAKEVASKPIENQKKSSPEAARAAGAAPRAEAPRQQAETKSSDVPPAAANKAARQSWSDVIGGLPLPLTGVAVMSAIIFFLLGLSAANLFVKREVAADARTQRNEASDDLSDRLAKAEAALAGPRAPDPALLGRIAAAETAAKQAIDNAASQQRRADELANLVRETRNRSEAMAADLARKNQAVASAEAAHGEVDALNARIAALEQTLKDTQAELNTRVSAAAAADQKNRLVVLSSSLLGAVERSAPFAAELAAARALAPDANYLAPLDAYAATGVPNAQALSRDMSALVPAMVKAASSDSPRDGNFLERLQASAERLVRIRPVGDVPGDQPANVIARIETKTARADIAGILQELAKLPPHVRAPADAWIKKAEASNAALAAAQQFSAGALAAIGKPNT